MSTLEHPCQAGREKGSVSSTFSNCRPLPGPRPPSADLQTLCYLWYRGCYSSLSASAGHRPLREEPEGQGGPQVLMLTRQLEKASV